MSETLRVYADATTLAAALADLVVETGIAAIANRGRFCLALSGGNTPRAAYALLARPQRAQRLSWRHVFVYFGDERCVPPRDERSNYRMARTTWLNAVGIPAANVARMRGEADPAIAASEYADALRGRLGPNPEFDLVLLGLGPDGHTASLFPGSDPQTDTDALVRAVYAPSQAMWRITLTPTVVNAARTVAFAVEGAEKAAILATVLDGPRDPTTHPAQIVAPSPGQLLWLTDRAAAARLRCRDD